MSMKRCNIGYMQATAYYNSHWSQKNLCFLSAYILYVWQMQWYLFFLKWCAGIVLSLENTDANTDHLWWHVKCTGCGFKIAKHKSRDFSEKREYYFIAPKFARSHSRLHTNSPQVQRFMLYLLNIRWNDGNSNFKNEFFKAEHFVKVIKLQIDCDVAMALAVFYVGLLRGRVNII